MNCASSRHQQRLCRRRGQRMKARGVEVQEAEDGGEGGRPHVAQRAQRLPHADLRPPPPLRLRDDLAVRCRAPSGGQRTQFQLRARGAACRTAGATSGRHGATRRSTPARRAGSGAHRFLHAPESAPRSGASRKFAEADVGRRQLRLGEAPERVGRRSADDYARLEPSPITGPSHPASRPKTPS